MIIWDKTKLKLLLFYHDTFCACKTYWITSLFKCDVYIWVPLLSSHLKDLPACEFSSCIIGLYINILLRRDLALTVFPWWLRTECPFICWRIAIIVYSQIYRYIYHFLGFPNAFTCFGFVSMAAPSYSVKQWLNSVICCWTLLLTKVGTLMCFICFDVGFNPFVSNKRTLMLSWQRIFEPRSYPWHSKKHLIHNMCGNASLTPIISLSVELVPFFLVLW